MHENEEAMKRIFRAPLVRYIETKGRIVQLIALGMADQARAPPSWNPIPPRGEAQRSSAGVRVG